MTSTLNSRIKIRAIVGIVTCFSVAAARAADLVTTFHFNPSLSREANPLVFFLGFDAAQLVASNLTGMVIFLFVPLLLYVVRGPARMEEQADSLTQYISLQIYRSKLPRSRFLCGVFLGWPLPKNWLQVTRLFGFALSWTIVFASLQATFAWWAIDYWGMDSYRQYRGILSFRGYPYPVIELVSALFVFYSLCYLFFRKEFKGYFFRPSEAEQNVTPNA